MRCPNFQILISLAISCKLLCGARTLDFKWVSANLSAPVIENAHFAGKGLWITEGMRHVRVPGGDAQRFLFATSSYQNRNRITYRAGHVNFPTMPDYFQRSFQICQPFTACAKFITIFSIISLKPSCANAKNQSPLTDVINGFCHL